MFCSSADWMERNFFRRIEVGFPIERRRHRRRILEELEAYLRDDVNAWALDAAGGWSRVPAAGEKPFCAQQWLLERYQAG